MKERRHFPRLDITKIDVSWTKDDNNRETDKVKNIAGGGIRLILDKGNVKIGDIINLKFSLPSGDEITSKGKVIWVRAFEILGNNTEVINEAGIEFIDISQKDKFLINQYIFSLMPPK